MDSYSDSKVTTHKEEGIVFQINGQASVGIRHKGGNGVKTGVLIMVGGRQTRVGAHRQFVQIARSLAIAGYPVFRFDVRGMGDSEGSPRHYLDLAEDIRAAMDVFKENTPDLEKIVIWGLCDGATATIVSLSLLGDVYGLFLVNPWLTTKHGAAKVQIKHYYAQRLFTSSFWKKFIYGKLDIVGSIKSLLQTTKAVITPHFSAPKNEVNLPSKVFTDLDCFQGRINIVISSYDMTALEFYDAYKLHNQRASKKQDFANVIRIDADHTFSKQEQHATLVTHTLDFLRICDSQ